MINGATERAYELDKLQETNQERILREQNYSLRQEVAMLKHDLEESEQAVIALTKWVSKKYAIKK